MKSAIRLTIIILFGASPKLMCQPIEFIGAWESGTGGNIVNSPLDWEAFNQQGLELIEQGLRLVDVETFKKPDSPRKYVGVWRSGTGGNMINPPLAWDAFNDKGLELIEKGLRLIDVELVLGPRNGRRYVGVWRDGSGGNMVTPPLAWKAFDEKGKEMIEMGLRLIDVETYKLPGQSRKYVGVWSSGSGPNLINPPLKWNEFEERALAFIDDGLRMKDFEVVRSASGERLYIGVWSSGTGANMIYPSKRWRKFSQHGEERVRSGLRLYDVELEFNSNAEVRPIIPPAEDPEPDEVAGFPSYIIPTNNQYFTIDFRQGDPQPKIFIPRICFPTYQLSRTKYFSRIICVGFG